MPYLKLMVSKSASDLFLTEGSCVKIKLEGSVVSVGKTTLSGEVVKQVLYSIMNEQQIAQYEETMECDFAITLPDNESRFRVNAFRQRGYAAGVLRRIPTTIPTAEELLLPEILTELICAKRGLLLMVGGSGSGKSTTLAAMINYRNATLPGHILTIEDPVEFSHPNQKSLINQREVGTDTLSYKNALRASLREAPDVILIGEIRDRETMETALELSNTGHLAISTMHANNANQAIERVINMFPQELHKQLFMDLSINFRAIISQRLVLDINKKRCAAMEIMINTPHIADLVLKGDLEKIKSSMEDSGQRGMQSFDMALYNLYQEGRIDLEQALDNADSRANLESKINFG